MSLVSLLSNLSSAMNSGERPEALEYCQIGGQFWVNLIGKSTDEAISEKIASGFDKSYVVAVEKAISEKLERQAFLNGRDEGLTICQTERSDGFAALPKNIPNAIDLVRENALNEAIERFVWAKWWDDSSTHHLHQIIERHTYSAFLGESEAFIEELAKNIEIQKLHLIMPHFISSEDKELLIFVLELKGGVITGGACGLKNDRQTTINRGMSELFRHGLVLVQNPVGKDQQSFYEKRLRFFASTEGLKLFQERLQKTGSSIVELPKLRFDSTFSHPAEKTHIVHRCLFEGQPSFVGGSLERMCL
jgi:hypothetical protein